MPIDYAALAKRNLERSDAYARENPTDTFSIYTGRLFLENATAFDTAQTMVDELRALRDAVLKVPEHRACHAFIAETVNSLSSIINRAAAQSGRGDV
jgi:hypothetical protein